MGSWYLSNLHHKAVAFNFNRLSVKVNNEQQSALKVALDNLSKNHIICLFDIGQKFLKNPNVINLNDVQWEDLSLENQVAISMQAINFLSYVEDHKGEFIEPVDLNIFLNTTPFELSRSDLYTALDSTLSNVKNIAHRWILEKLLSSLKKTIYAEKAGYSNYQAALDAYSPEITISPEAVITAFRMSNALMLKTHVDESGRVKSGENESALLQIYSGLLNDVIDATPQESGFDNDTNKPIYSIRNPNPAEYISQIINGLNLFGPDIEHIWLQGIKTTPFLESLALITLKEFGYNESEVSKIILSSKQNPLELFSLPVMNHDNYSGVYKNILLVNAIFEYLCLANRSLAHTILKPLINHIDQNYLFAPDSKPKDIQTRYTVRKSVGDPNLSDYTGKYRSVRYGF